MADYGFEIRRRDMVAGYIKRALVSIAEGRTYHFDSAADFAKATMEKVERFGKMSDAELRVEFNLPAEVEESTTGHSMRPDALGFIDRSGYRG